MADFGFYPRKDDDSAAVEDLLLQANDLYVLEQVAAVNLSGFANTSLLPNDLDTRFRRLKSLPVSRPDPVSSFSKKQSLSHSKSFSVKSRPFDSSVVEGTRTQSLKLLPKEKFRTSSSSSFTSIDLASPSTELNRAQERSNRKSKSKLSWFDKLLPSKAIGCLWSSPTKSSTNSRKTKKSSDDEGFLKKAMEVIEESQRLRREADKLIKKVRKLSSSSSRF